MGKRLLTIYIIFIFASLISSLSKCPFPGYGTSCAILTIFGTIGRDSRSHGVGFIIFIVAVCLFVGKNKGKKAPHDFLSSSQILDVRLIF